MNIDQYIELLEKSSVDYIERRHLMQDNFNITLNADIPEIFAAELFRRNFSKRGEKEGHHFFKHVTGSVVQAVQRTSADLHIIYREINFRKYNATISLHLDHTSCKEAGYHYMIAGREALKDIVQIAKEERIRFCLPFTSKLKDTNGLIEYYPK